MIVTPRMVLIPATIESLRTELESPGTIAELLRMDGIPASVRTVNLAGEALPNELAQALYALGTVEKVGNLYGPTEDTTYSTYSVVERGSGQVFVGRPIANRTSPNRSAIVDRFGTM